MGRDQGRRVHDCLVHVDLIDGKIWVQQDGIVKELLHAGLPRQDIILGFRSPQFRAEMAAAHEESISPAEAS